MKLVPPSKITLPQFTAVFVPFGVLAGVALMWPETTNALELNRTKATIWTTTILLIPALVLYQFQTVSDRTANLGHLFWSFAYAMFLVHAYWAMFVIFNGVADTFAQMGRLIASVNFLLVVWWGLDVLLLWTARSGSPRMARFHRSSRVFTFLIFAVTLVALRGGSVRVLGVVFVASVVLALLIRWWARDRSGLEHIPAR